MNKKCLEFVKGMAVHDIAKPLYLGGEKHSLLGYVILSALGRPMAALTALIHHNWEENLNFHFDHGAGRQGLQVPGYLILASAIDVLTSTAYSFLDIVPKVLENSAASVQNPFTRLPLRWRQDAGETKLCGKNHEALGKVFRQDLVRRFAAGKLDEVEAKIDNQLFRRMQAGWKLKGVFEQWAKQGPLLDVLKGYMDKFGERTYPPMNDTTLAEHARLSAALAVVILHNMEKANYPLLTEVVHRQANKYVVAGKPLKEWFDRKEDGLSLAKAEVAKNAECVVTRVVFSGFQNMFKSAARVDDLRGLWRVVEERLKPAFKVRVAAAMGGEEGDEELGNILALAEGAFEMTYLMPACWSKEEIEGRVVKAYRQAIEDVTHRLLGEMERDFRPVRDRLDVSKQGDELVRQMRGMLLGVGMRPVVPNLAERNYGALCADYSSELLKSFKASSKGVSVPQQLVEEALERAGGVGEVCDACGANPLYEEFNALLLTEPYLRKVVHEFRGEPEKLCVSCIAFRVMSHGHTEIEALGKIIVGEPGTDRVKVKAADFPDIPPLMVRLPMQVKEGDYVDMGAAFVRRRGGELQRFATIDYAADEDSNVALIQLSPVERGILGTYDLEDLVKGRGSPGALDYGDLKTYYIDICDRVKGQPSWEQMVKVEPHFARVLQRMTLVREFFGHIQDDLEAGKIRALPIATTYPSAVVAVPATRLVDAVKVIHQRLIERLLGSGVRLYEAPENVGDSAEESLGLLNAIAPKLLYGAAVVFKHKQPLYVVMEVADKIIEGLEWEDQQKKREWGGVLFGFADLRGVISERELVQARLPFVEAYRVIDACGEVDRRSLLSTNALLLGEELSEAKGEKLPKIAGASLYIRGSKQRWGEETLKLLQENRYFKPVVFLRRMAR
jgi:hypothetical protein